MSTIFTFRPLYLKYNKVQLNGRCEQLSTETVHLTLLWYFGDAIRCPVTADLKMVATPWYNWIRLNIASKCLSVINIFNVFLCIYQLLSVAKCWRHKIFLKFREIPLVTMLNFIWNIFSRRKEFSNVCLHFHLPKNSDSWFLKNYFMISSNFLYSATFWRVFRAKTQFKMEQFDQLLTCCVCLDRYRNPKLLPCQHSYCMEPCMEGLVDYVKRQVKCPECRAEHRIPFNGIQGFPTNYTLTKFLELHAEITGKKTVYYFILLD